MSYLDPSVIPDILARFFSDVEQRRRRLAGNPPPIDSEYSDLVRFFGSGAVDPAKVGIGYVDGLYRFDDDLIASYAREAARRLRDEGRLHVGPPVARVADADFESERPRVLIQASTYDQQAGSCFALDMPTEQFTDHGGSLREYYLRKYPKRTLRHHPLCLCLGVCGMLLVGEGDQRRLLTVRRSSHLASLGSSWGPSVAGSVDFVDGTRNLHELFRTALGQETEEELGLRPDEFELLPLGWGLEIFRGERPQLFGLINSRVETRKLERRLNELAGQGHEFDAWRWIRLDLDALRVDRHAMFNHEARANALLLEEYLASSGE